jgi:hypothetical protein
MRRTAGWSEPFRQKPWDTIAARFHDIARAHPPHQHMADIVDSVLASGVAHKLAGNTVMHDLIVIDTPIPDPPYAVIYVCSPFTHHGGVGLGGGWVRIFHHSVTGRLEQIDRPSSEALALFWRFVIEKFGVRPVRA